MLTALLLSTALAAAEPDARSADDVRSWDATAAAWSAGALVAADAVVFFGGVALIAATTPRHCGHDICLDPSATLLALASMAVVPPTVALLVANRVHRAPGATERALLAYAAQGAAIGLLAAAASTGSSSSGQTALLAAAAALHLVGIPVALGFAAPRALPAPGARLAGTPTFGVSFSW